MKNIVIMMCFIPIVITLSCKEIDKAKYKFISEILANPDDMEQIIKSSVFYSGKWDTDFHSDCEFYKNYINNYFPDYDFILDKKVAKQENWEITHFHHWISIENDNKKIFFLFESKERIGPWYLVRMSSTGWPTPKDAL